MPTNPEWAMRKGRDVEVQINLGFESAGLQQIIASALVEVDRAAREDERKRCVIRVQYHGICGSPSGRSNPAVSMGINRLAAWQQACGAVEKSIAEGEWIPDMEKAMKKEVKS